MSKSIVQAIVSLDRFRIQSLSGQYGISVKEAMTLRMGDEVELAQEAANRLIDDGYVKIVKSSKASTPAINTEEEGGD